MSRIIGCRDLHIAPLVSDPISGKPTYKTPTRVPSLVSINITDTVESSKFYSDDTVEQAFNKTSGKEVTIELGYITNELEALITGKKVDEKGVLIQSSNSSPTELAIMFRAPKSKDSAFRYICLYKGTLSRTEAEYATQEDGVESSTVTLTGTFMPLVCNSNMAAVADSDDLKAATAIEAWFTTVYDATMDPTPVTLQAKSVK